MSGKNNVEFLLEIIKGATTTKQEQVDNEPQVDGVCGGHCDVEVDEMTEMDTEIREQPQVSPQLTKPSQSKPNSSIPEGVWAVKDFDFYGNPIRERAQQDRLENNNYIASERKMMASPTHPNNGQLARREFTTEFPDGSTAPSCLIDFSMCLMNSLICSTGPCLLKDVHAYDTNSQSLFGTTEEKAAIAKIEAEMQLELEKVRKQKAEMEKWYLREIARQDADKTLLQVQMEKKLVSMIEARLHLEKEYKQEISREVTEVRTLVNTQLDLGSRSDVSDDAEVEDAVVTETDQLDEEQNSPAEPPIPTVQVCTPTELNTPITPDHAVPYDVRTDVMMKTTIVLSGTDEESAIETESNVVSYPVEASE